jgi:hypothetical protein
VPLEVLNLAFVLLGGAFALEGAEVAALAGLRVLLARIEPVFAGFELADHAAGTLGGGVGLRLS